MTEMPENVKVRIGNNYGNDSIIISLTQEDKNEERLNVAVLRDGKFVPARLWAPDYDQDSDDDVYGYASAEDLALIIANVKKLAGFAEFISEHLAPV